MKTNLFSLKNQNSLRIKTENEEANLIFPSNISKIIGHSFDNKLFLNTPSKKNEIIKTNSKNRFSTISNEKLQSYKKLILPHKKALTDAIINSKEKNINHILNDNNYRSEKNILYNNSINEKNLSLNKNYLSKLYLKTEPNNLELQNNINKREKFIFSNEIKRIKRNVDSSHKDKSIQNIMNNNIAFDKKNSKVALKPIKLLNSYNDYKQTEIIKNKNDIFSFLTEKSKISRNNILINLLIYKKKDYNDMLSAHQKNLEELTKNLESEEKHFQTLTTNQKISSRKIEEMLNKLIVKKRQLLVEEYYLKSDIRTKTDERKKLLDQIDELKIIAKFVTKALGGKGELFNYKINLENLSDDDEHYDKETKKIFQNLDFLLNNKIQISPINQDDIDIYNEISSLNDSDMLFYQLWKKEDNILNNLQRKEILNREILRNEEKNENIFIHLKNRISILEKELIFYNEIYEREKNEYENIYRQKYADFSDFEEIITDLYDFVMNIKNKNLKRIIDIEHYASVLNDITIKKEEKINKLIYDLEKFEQEDKELFAKVLNNIKNINKEMHISNVKKIIELGEKNKLKLLKIHKDKIVLKNRRNEPPYFKAKKPKIIKIDPELIKQQENQELLTYE